MGLFTLCRIPLWTEVADVPLYRTMGARVWFTVPLLHLALTEVCEKDRANKEKETGMCIRQGDISEKAFWHNTVHSLVLWHHCGIGNGNEDQGLLLNDWLVEGLHWVSEPAPNHKQRTREERRRQNRTKCEHGPTYRQGANMEREACCQVLTQCNHTSCPPLPHTSCPVQGLGPGLDGWQLWTVWQPAAWLVASSLHRQPLTFRQFKQSEGF